MKSYKGIFVLILALFMGISSLVLNSAITASAKEPNIANRPIILGDGAGTKGSGPGEEESIIIDYPEDDRSGPGDGTGTKGSGPGDGAGTKGTGPEDGAIIFANPPDQVLPCFDKLFDSDPSNRMPAEFRQISPDKIDGSGDEEK